MAIGLAMDCFAVSVATGIEQGKWRNKALLMAFLFGLFQGGMPLIGYFAGISFADWISRYDHWIALILLCFIGGRMIVESLQTDKKDNPKKEQDPFRLSHLLLLAVATSIDALATGVLFVSTPQIVWWAVSIIALTSFVFSLVGFGTGVVFGAKFRWNMTLIGGIILVGIGIKIFVEHMWF